MYKKNRLLLVVLSCAVAMFNNVAWGQRNQEIYNLEADWEKTEANYREQLNRCRENLRKFERELQQYEQEEKQLVASGAKENPDYITLGEPALLRVRKEIFVAKEDIEATKNEIRRIEDQINNGRRNLEYMKQKIQQRIEEEARRQREAKEAEERRQREAREAEAKRQRDEEQKQVELRNKKRKEQEAREAAEKKRKQEEDQRRAEEQRRKAEEERIREEQRREEQRRKDEERRAEIDRKYNESKRRNQPRIDRWVSSQNEAFERNKEYFDEKKASDYSTNSVMSEQRGSLGGSYSTARLNKNNMQNNSDELHANVGNSILQRVKKKEQDSKGLDLNTIPITQRDPQSSYDNNPFKDGMLKVEKREFGGDMVYVDETLQSQNVVGVLWDKFDKFMLSYEDSEYGDRTMKNDNLLMYTIRSCYTDVRDFSVDTWERYEISNRVAGSFQSIKNGAIKFVDDPIGFIDNARDNVKEKTIGYIKENALKPVKYLSPNSSKAVERAQNIMNAEKETIDGMVLLLDGNKLVRALDNPNEWFKEQRRFEEKTLKRISSLAGSVAESEGLVNYHNKITKYVYDLPKNEEELSTYAKEQLKKETENYIKDKSIKAFKKSLPDGMVKNLEFYGGK